jgi:hypothetical protein
MDLTYLVFTQRRKSMIGKNTVSGRVALAKALLVASLWGSAYAVEGGKSLYLLGKRGPLAGLIPKPGWYITNDMYYYSSDTDQEIPIAGLLNNPT